MLRFRILGIYSEYGWVTKISVDLAKFEVSVSSQIVGSQNNHYKAEL